MIYFFLIKSENSITTYSGKLFAEGMKSAGCSVEVIQDDAAKQEILNTIQEGTIIFQKCLHPLHQAAKIKHLKGKVKLIHLDDDWMDMTNQAHLDTLKMTDLVLVVSLEHQKALANDTKTPCQRIFTLPDLKNFKYYPFEARQNDPLIVLWQQSCADAYVKDLLSIAEPLTKLYNKYRFQLKLYGWHLGKGYPDRRDVVQKQLPFAELIPYVSLNEYLTKIVPEIRSADIFIVPYLDHSSRKGKGGFGLRRMMSLGIPVIVSAIGSHLEIITDGIDGFLAKSNLEWEQKLEKLLNDAQLRKQFSLNGLKLMETKFGEGNCLKIFIEAIKLYL